MFYKLNDSYQLVGWRKLPGGVLNTETNKVFFLPREAYSLLLHMNGKEEIAQNTLTSKQKEIIQQFLERKLIQKSEKPFSTGIESIYHFFDNVYIESVHWSITGKCNYRCRHCFLSAPKNHTEDLSTEQCLDIIHQIVKCGIRKISFTGGEPLVRKDFLKLVQACTDAGVQITEIYTNGALLTPCLLKKIVDFRQHPAIHISYDGLGWHDWVRGHEGAQQIAEEAIHAAHKAGLKTVASMCVFKDNIKVIRETVKFLASLNVDTIKISPMLDLGLWKENYAIKTLSTEEFLRTILNYIPEFFADGKPCSIEMGGYFAYIKEMDVSTTFLAKAPNYPMPIYPCPALATNLYISSAGMLYPCMEFAGMDEDTSFPDLQQIPLTRILRDSAFLGIIRTKLQDIYDQNPECQECPEKGKHCGQSCRAHATPGFCGIDRNTCYFIKDGWLGMIRETVEKAGGNFVLRGEIISTD